MGDPLYTDIYLKKTFDFFKEIKKQTYMPFVSVKGKVIDVGCGVGQDAENLAMLLQENCQVIGLDNDQQVIDAARNKNSHIKNLRFEQSDAGSLPFEDNEISGLRNERLIQHLKAPKTVYQEFYRVLKPGAPAIFVETDWDSAIFYNGNHNVRDKLSYFLANQRVNNGRAVGNLIEHLTISGFRSISIQVFPIVSYELPSVSMLIQLDTALETMINRQIISETEGKDFIRELKEADEANCFAGSVNFVMITAFK